MRNQKGENIKFWLTIALPVVAILIAYMRLSHTQTHATKSEADARQNEFNILNTKHQILEGDVKDLENVTANLKISDEKNSSDISRLKDGLIIFATKEEMNAKFGNSSTTLKTDMMGVDSWLQNFNQRISHMEGAWQTWNIYYFHSTPVRTSSITVNDPNPQPIYDGERYK